MYSLNKKMSRPDNQLRLMRRYLTAGELALDCDSEMLNLLGLSSLEVGK